MAKARYDQVNWWSGLALYQLVVISKHGDKNYKKKKEVKMIELWRDEAK